MSYGFLTHASTQPRGRRASPAAHIASPLTHPSLRPQPAAADRPTVGLLLEQISQAIITLGNAASELLYSQTSAALVARLQTQARRAEAAMHRLVDINNVSATLVMDLSQHVTALVLLADMLADGHADCMTPHEWECLVDRNMQQATSYMGQFQEASRMVGW